MAGIKGQPTPKPADVASPVPDTGASASALDSFMAEESKLNEFMAAEAAPTELVDTSEPAPQGMLADATEMVANALPIAGGIVGGIAGFGAGPAGSAALGALGAAGGSAWKQVILQDVLKRVPQQGAMDRAIDQGMEAGTSALGSLAGYGLSKGVAKLATTKWGQAATTKIAEQAAKPLAALKETFQKEFDDIYAGVEKIIAGKTTPLTQEEAGNAIKQQLGQDIKNRFSGFVSAYKNLDDVAANVPLTATGDLVETSSGKLVGRAKNPVTAFTDAVRNEGLDQPKATYGLMKQYADRFDQSVNGKDFVKVMGDLRKEADQASAAAVKYNSNIVRDRAAALMKFADDAESHYEDKIIGGIAKRIADGKATMPEIDGFQRMMAAQQGPGVPIDPKNLNAYTKSVAKDYLEQKAAVKQNYAQFRGLLEDIGDVTKVKSSRMGPRQFERALSEVPSDVLAERAFDPKNAEALRVMGKQYPQVYDMIVRNKMSSIVAKNVDLDGTINYRGIAETVKGMPESSAKLLLNNSQYDELMKAVNNPRIELLTQKQRRLANRIVMELAHVGENVRMAGNVASRTQASPLLPKTSQAVGQGVMQAVSPLSAFREPTE